MAKEVHIKIDDVIGAYRDDFGFIWHGFMAYMLEGALEANPDAEHITIHGDGPGGDIIEGYRIYQRLIDFRESGGTVRFINEGMTASMLTVVAQAATPGMREARQPSTWMMHKPLYDQLNCVNANDLRKLAFQLDNFEETLLNIFVSATGNPIEVVKAHFEEEIFISAEEAVRRGYLDKIIEADASFKPKVREAKAVAFYNPPKENTNNLTIEHMAKTKESALDKVVAFIKNLAGEEEATPQNDAGEPETPAPVAATSTLENGDTIYHEGDLAEGVSVFTDAEMTAALSDGEHVLSDGRVLTVASGIVEAITEPAPANSADAEALVQANAEIERLKGELATVTNAKDTTIKNLRTDLANARKVTPKQNFAGDNSGNAAPELVPFNSAAEKIKAKYNRK